MVKVMQLGKDGEITTKEGGLEEILGQILGESGNEPQAEKAEEHDEHECPKCRHERLVAGHNAGQGWLAGYVLAKTGFNVINKGQDIPDDMKSALLNATAEGASLIDETFKVTPLHEGAMYFATSVVGGPELNPLAELNSKFGAINKIMADDSASPEEKARAAMEGLKLLVKAGI